MNNQELLLYNVLAVCIGALIGIYWKLKLSIVWDRFYKYIYLRWIK